MSCFFNKALVNVGADLARQVPGRVSTEIDARLAYDTQGIVRKFLSCSFCQAAAAAQASASVIQIFVGRIRDWARNRSGDPEIEAATKRGEDPGLVLVTKAYNYIHKYGHKSKLMAAAVRNKQDLFSLLGVDYIIAPLKILQSLKESVTYPEEEYLYATRLSPSSAMEYNFSDEELVKWDQRSFQQQCAPLLKSSWVQDSKDTLTKHREWRSFLERSGHLPTFKLLEREVSKLELCFSSLCCVNHQIK